MDKRCVRCGLTKTLDEFSVRNSSLDGHDYYCRQCKSERAKESYRKNPEPAKSRAKKHYDAMSDEQRTKEQARLRTAYNNNTEKFKQRARDWYQSNKERHATAARKWAEDNKEQVRAQKKQYSQTHRNPEIGRLNNSRRRARLTSVKSTLTIKEWRWLLELCDYRCLCCGKQETTLDHIVPLSPGDNSLDNAQPLCMECNRKKWAKTIDYRPQWLKDMVAEMQDQKVFYGKITTQTATRLIPSKRAQIGV